MGSLLAWERLMAVIKGCLGIGVEDLGFLFRPRPLDMKQCHDTNPPNPGEIKLRAHTLISPYI